MISNSPAVYIDSLIIFRVIIYILNIYLTSILWLLIFIINFSPTNRSPLNLFNINYINLKLLTRICYKLLFVLKKFSLFSFFFFPLSTLQGIDLCIEENGNISARKLNGKCEIIVRPYDTKHNALPDKLLLNNGRALSEPSNTPSVIFDLCKFKSNIFKELNNGQADRTRLENQCICTVVFIRESTTNDSGLYNPVWLLLINIVALDFLRSKYIGK